MRVIAGTLGGRKLKSTPGLALRPTADRVKEALFSVLGPLDGVRVLDLYAGTGSLGIESLSRGAEIAVFVERGRDALRVLEENLAALRIEDQSVVLPVDVARAAREIARRAPFDLVFADPPYAELANAMLEIERIVHAPGVASPEAILVVEHAARDEPTHARLRVTDRRRYGDTGLTLFAIAE